MNPREELTKIYNDTMEWIKSEPELQNAVAAAYKEILSEFKERFRHIKFAVYCTLRDRENYNVFKKISES